MVDATEDATPGGVTVGFLHARALYKAMAKKSVLVNPIDLITYSYPQDDPDEKIRVFEGFTSKIADKLGMSQHQRGKALQILKAMNCMTRLRTPGGGSPGVWILHYEPTAAQWLEFRNNNLEIIRVTMPSPSVQIRSQFMDLTNEIKKANKNIHELVTRVSELESIVYGGHDVRPSPPVS